jgi:ribosomal protein S18 acetylase RimI-like enzyme
VAREKGAKQVFLHAWVQNEDGVQFYTKHGFTVTEKLPGYYKNLSPPDAVVLSLEMK